jgi:hypothetical protein
MGNLLGSNRDYEEKVVEEKNNSTEKSNPIKSSVDNIIHTAPVTIINTNIKNTTNVKKLGEVKEKINKNNNENEYLNTHNKSGQELNILDCLCKQAHSIKTFKDILIINNKKYKHIIVQRRIKIYKTKAMEILEKMKKNINDSNSINNNNEEENTNEDNNNMDYNEYDDFSENSLKFLNTVVNLKKEDTYLEFYIGYKCNISCKINPISFNNNPIGCIENERSSIFKSKKIMVLSDEQARCSGLAVKDIDIPNNLLEIYYSPMTDDKAMLEIENGNENYKIDKHETIEEENDRILKRLNEVYRIDLQPIISVCQEHLGPILIKEKDSSQTYSFKIPFKNDVIVNSKQLYALVMDIIDFGDGNGKTYSVNERRRLKDIIIGY